ncbi:MAG: response regulator [Kofleriaceae bacterium]|nr:response regulator [Kofleriaceae bacterium]
MNSEESVVVLVVEADPYTQALERALLGTQYATEFVADGEEALSVARRLRPRLLIADILVPKIDGLRLCRLLKENPATRDIPVLIFTELLAERRAREAGADGFLRKPIDEKQFLGEVQRLLKAHEEAWGPWNE